MVSAVKKVTQQRRGEGLVWWCAPCVSKGKQNCIFYEQLSGLAFLGKVFRKCSTGMILLKLSFNVLVFAIKSLRAPVISRTPFKAVSRLAPAILAHLLPLLRKGCQLAIPHHVRQVCPRFLLLRKSLSAFFALQTCPLPPRLC